MCDIHVPLVNFKLILITYTENIEKCFITVELTSIDSFRTKKYLLGATDIVSRYIN
jgi:hypothetical protein